MAAQTLAAAIMPHRQVGSGRVQGRPDNAVDRVIGASREGTRLRKTALDQYTPGLGTLPHGVLARSLDRFGDSLLLRLVMDIGGWDVDRFEQIPF